MTPWLALLHVLGATLPVLAMATWMAYWGSRQASVRERHPARRCWLIHAGVGMLVMLGGWALFGRDGKMATYAALVLASATVQWVLARGWRP